MKNLYLLLLLSIVSFQGFSQNYTVLGSSTPLGSCHSYQLTPNSGGQAGAIFQNQTINMNNSFDYTFSNFFGCNGSNGADGEAFVLTTNPNGLGNQGEGLGYGGTNQPCSFAIEFDTWQNGNHNDPPYDHTAFESGGSVDHNVAGPVSALPTQANLDDCNWHTIHIVWNVNTNTMSVSIDGSLRISQVFPNFISSFLCGNPVVNWGWTGSTGGGWNLQQVNILSTSNWVAGNNYQSCSTTVQFTDISSSSVGPLNSWQWTFGDGGTSTLQNPLHTYASTGTYNASLITVDASGCADTFSHAVAIDAPIVLTPTITDAPCNGGQNGSIAVSLTGGFGVSAGHGGFTYTWNNGNPFATNSGLGTGTYTLTVTDGVCTATGQYTVGQPNALSASTTSTAASCGVANGTCSITISGGTPPYSGVTFAGNAAAGGPNTFTTGGFIGGTYIADFHDAHGCSALLQYTSTVTTLPCGIISSTSTTNVLCFGGNTGSATLNVSGPGVSPPSTITWTRGGVSAGNGATISNLVAGTYNYTYSDQNGANTFSGAVNITQPGAAFVATLATSNISCAGLNNGQAVASVTSGGIAPFTYTWSGGQPNNPVASNLGQGAITVVVDDATGCSATATASILSAPALTLNINPVNNACNQFNSGSAAANVTGGNPPYQYTWSNIASGQTDLNLSAGTYTVTVTDNSSCTITQSTTISSSPPLLNTVSSTNVTCFGDSTGTITVSTSGGTLPYSYSWSSDTVGTVNPNLTGANIATLKAGEYLLTITDAGGCLFSDTTFIQQPATALSVTSSHGDVTCFGANNGYIAIAATGGTPPYTFNGQPASANGLDTMRNLAPGNQSGTVLDANGCSVVVTANITSPLAGSLVITQVDNVCNGAATGSATANFVNATGSVIYQWSNNQTGPTISNLLSNTYFVTATDANSCVLTNSVLIGQPTAISLQVAQVNNNCYSGAAGSITITSSGGGGGPYTYNWNPNVSSTNTASALAAGPYAITVTDQNLCTKDTVITITQPASPITAVYQVTDVACFGGSTGSISITPSNGISPFSYTWNPTSASSSNSASNLASGSYAVTISDANGCTIDSSLNITQPLAALTLGASHTDLSCFGSNDGTATVIPNGGTSPFTYAWTGNTNSTTATATALTIGNYSVLVTDNHNCTATQAYVIAQPTAITAVINNQVNPLCNNTPTGAISYTVSGGAGGYTYTWSPNVSTSNTATNIVAGTYQTTVTDATGCSTIQTTTLISPTAISIASRLTNVTCFGLTNGSINTFPTGGTPGYSYVLTDGANPQNSTTGQFNGLAANSYKIIVTDQNGCMDTSAVSITQPNQLTDNIIPTEITCANASNGGVTIQASNGTRPYSYAITGQAANSTGVFTGLQPGVYYVIITDSNNCVLDDSVTITQPIPLALNSSIQQPNCASLPPDGKIILNVTGGTAPYGFAWSKGSGDSILPNLKPGSYHLTVSDNGGCSVQDSFDLAYMYSFSVSGNPMDSILLGKSDTLGFKLTGNAGIYTVAWSDEASLNCNNCNAPVASPYVTTTYAVSITNDSSGCSAVAYDTVVVIPHYVLFIPNAFSANGDGRNDYLSVYGNLDMIQTFDMKIFDRWGETVYETIDPNFKWDGSYKGDKAQDGVYIYIVSVTYLDGYAPYLRKGSFTLFR